MPNTPLSQDEQADLRMSVTAYIDQQRKHYMAQGKSHDKSEELALDDFRRMVLEVKAQARSEQ